MTNPPAAATATRAAAPGVEQLARKRQQAGQLAGAACRMAFLPLDLIIDYKRQTLVD